jgi:hypothetical protein
MSGQLVRAHGQTQASARVLSHIEGHQAAFGEHGFFRDLHDPDGLAFAPLLTFWVLVFQDVLRLNEVRAADASTAAVVREHRREDRGHDRWFLHDLDVLGQARPGIDDVFGYRHAATRDAAYALVAESFRVDDALRVVLLLTLESAGHVFFGRVAAAVDHLGLGGELKYFSSHHLDVEQEHQVFDRGLEVAPDREAEAIAMVDRCYAAFTSMLDGLMPRVAAGPAHGVVAMRRRSVPVPTSAAVRISGAVPDTAAV